MIEKLTYVILLIILHLPVYAAESGVIIRGSRIDTPASVDVIAVSDSDRQVKTLSGLLESRAGIHAMRYGTSGSYSSIYVRGTNSNQLAVYVDGIPLSDSAFGETNFENIPLDSLERIEIYKSFAPVYFASPGIGGVINLITRKDNRSTGTGMSLAAGSFNTYRISLFQSLAGDQWNLFFTGAFSGSSGDFQFNNNNGTAFNPDDDFSDKRGNNNFKSGTGSVRFSYNGDGTLIDAVSDVFVKNQGVASYNNAASDASLDTLSSRNYARIKREKIAGLPLNWQISVFTNVQRSVFNDLESEIGFFAKKSTGVYLTYGADSYTEFAVPELFQELSLSVQWQSESYYLKDETPAEIHSYSPQKRSTLRAGIQDNITFFNERLGIIPQVRFETRHDSFSENDDSDVSVHSADPQLGVIFWPVRNLFFIKGSYSRNHRAPDFSELFGDKGTVQGNTDLKDETSDNLDFTAGITHSDFTSDIIQAVSIEYSFFRTGIKNIIIFMQNSQYTMKAENISAASITGHEITASMTVLDFAELSSNITLQYAKDRSSISYYSGNYLPHRPVLEGEATLRVFSKNGSISYQYSYAGGNYRDRANSESLYIEHRNFHAVTAVWNPRFDLAVTIEAENISDNRTQDVAGYPLPGRSFTGSVQYIF